MQRIFVVGCPRSGTTLVQALLARHPDVFSLPETYFFESLLGDAEVRWGDRWGRPTRRWYHRAGMAQSWGRRRLRELEDAWLARGRHRKRAPRAWKACARRYLAMLDAAASAAGLTCWVEKSPGHLLYLDEIAACIPDARFVHVLRNGMDVVASALDAEMRQDTSGFRGGIGQWARRWNRAMQLHREHLGVPRHYLVCLEDLIAEVDGEWAGLRRFAGLDPDKALLPAPGSTIADATREPWKKSAVAGLVAPVDGKAQQVFGPSSLAWLRQSLDDYASMRAAVHAQRAAAGRRAGRAGMDDGARVHAAQTAGTDASSDRR